MHGIVCQLTFQDGFVICSRIVAPLSWKSLTYYTWIPFAKSPLMTDKCTIQHSSVSSYLVLVGFYLRINLGSEAQLATQVWTVTYTQYGTQFAASTAAVLI